MEPLREERLFARLHLEKEAAYVECYSVSRALGGKCRELDIVSSSSICNQAMTITVGLLDTKHTTQIIK